MNIYIYIYAVDKMIYPLNALRGNVLSVFGGEILEESFK